MSEVLTTLHQTQQKAQAFGFWGVFKKTVEVWYFSLCPALGSLWKEQCQGTLRKAILVPLAAQRGAGSSINPTKNLFCQQG